MLGGITNVIAAWLDKDSHFDVPEAGDKFSVETRSRTEQLRDSLNSQSAFLIAEQVRLERQIAEDAALLAETNRAVAALELARKHLDTELRGPTTVGRNVLRPVPSAVGHERPGAATVPETSRDFGRAVDAR